MEKMIDFFSFGWHITKASIYEERLNNSEIADKEFGKAGWYRKIYLEKMFKVESTDLFSILNVYKNLGINSILEKIYINMLENEIRTDEAFLSEAGERFIAFKNWKNAAEAFCKVISSDKTDTMTYYYLGLSNLNLKRFEQAKISFEKAVGLNPDFADAYYQLGLIARKRIKWEEAKKYFEKALDILPNHLECLKALQKIYKRNGENSKSKKSIII